MPGITRYSYTRVIYMSTFMQQRLLIGTHHLRNCAVRAIVKTARSVKNRTLPNLSHWPQEKVDALSAVLTQGPSKHSIEDSFSIIRSLPHGHVAAVLGMIKNLGLDSLIDVMPIYQPFSVFVTPRGLDSRKQRPW